MEVFPGAYVARLSLTAAAVLGALVITVISSRIGFDLGKIDGVTTRAFQCTTWLAVLTLSIETVLLTARAQPREKGQRADPNVAMHWGQVDRVWPVTIWVLWLADVIWVTRTSSRCARSREPASSTPLINVPASVCSNIGALCALTWVEWLLFTSRLLVMAAKTVCIRLHHLIQALKRKLAPWWKAIKEPVVQIAASVGVLLSGVVASVGLLAMGLFGVVDRISAVVGLGGMRRQMFSHLGLFKVAAGVDKLFATLGFSGLRLLDEPESQEPNLLGAGSAVNELGLGTLTGNTGKNEESGGLPIVGSLTSRVSWAAQQPLGPKENILRKRGSDDGG